MIDSLLQANQTENSKKTNLLATLDVFHGDELLGLLVPHEPSHPKIAGPQILDLLVLIHAQQSL